MEIVTTSNSLPAVQGISFERGGLAVQNPGTEHRAGIIDEIQYHGPVLVEKAPERNRVAVLGRRM